MEQLQLRNFEAQCVQEEPPACQTMCPLHVDARAFARLMADGKVGDARKLLDRTLPLSCLMGYLCEGPCMQACRRGEVDGAINLPLLERACTSLSRSMKPMPLPSSGKTIAIAGAGLSSLVAAWELGKKGHSVTIFHAGAVGGRLCALSPDHLPQQALETALEQLVAVRVKCIDVTADSAVPVTDSMKPGEQSTDAPSMAQWLNAEWITQILAEYGALYLGLDDTAVAHADTGLTAPGGSIETNPLTLQTGQEQVFAGGFAAQGEALFIQEAADGKRAALSIDRLLQGVSPATAREKEGPYPSSLYTDISGVSPSPAVPPSDPFAPALEEAQAEAGRCIQCECLECVKKCTYLAHYKGYPKKYGREIYNNLSVVHGLRQANTMINSCARCGLCASVCPQNADMGAFCSTARKEMVQTNRMPPSAHEFALEDMAFSNSGDIAFFRHQPGHTQSAALFFPGCQLPASLPAQTEAVYAHLQKLLPGGVGFMLGCCGAPARWSEREHLVHATVAAFRKVWTDAGKPRLILACASCVAFFTAEMADIPVQSLWDVLAELPLPETAVSADTILALHDPCAAREADATQNNVRRILQMIRQQVEELPLRQGYTRCCGYGGLASAANPTMGEKYALDRAGDTDNNILAYCIMCRDRLSAVGKPALHLLDLLFPNGHTAEAVARPAPGISERQETRLAFRRRLLQTLWGEEPVRNPAMDAYTLHISDTVAQKLEARRILRTDIKTVLMHAETQGALFFNPATGHSLASLRPRQVSFWVEFNREDDGSFTIHDAYCHRMVVPGVPGQGTPGPCGLEGCAPKGGRM